MGEHDVQDRVKMVTTPAARTRTETDAGPFSAGATRVADADSLKNLIEMTAVHDDFERDDRKTREVDPAQFRALLTQKAAAETARPAQPAPAPEPPKPASFEDELDAAFADPELAADAAAPAAVEAAPEVAAAPVAEPEVVPEPALAETVEPALAAPPEAPAAPPEAPADVGAAVELAHAAPDVSIREADRDDAVPTAAAAARTAPVRPVLTVRLPSARALVIASLALLVIATLVFVFAVS